MIKLHKLNGTEITINAELVESVEAVPDTKIVLITGNQFIVKEDVDTVIEKIREYESSIKELKSKNIIVKK